MYAYPADQEMVSRPDGLQLGVSRWNVGAPRRVILSHGGGQTRHSWGGTAAALADQGFEVISFDHRGHGDSSWSPESNYEMAEFTADAIALTEHVGGPVTWVGASLGGMTGLLAVDARPSLFDRLVLVDITPRPAMAGVERILSFMAKDAAAGFASLDEAADAVAAYQPHRQRPKDLSGLEKNLRLSSDGRWRWHWDPTYLTGRKSMVNSNEDDRHTRLEAVAARLTLPTLLIRGKLSDLVTDAEVQAFRELTPHLQYVDVADAAHMIAGDKNDVFTEAVLSFVNRSV